MPSNGMYVCLDCRVGGKGLFPACVRDNHRTMYFGTRITVPKKNNDRAWKRIENGELLWNRRKTKVRRAQAEYWQDLKTYRKNHKGRVWWGRPATGTYLSNPSVDLGG